MSACGALFQGLEKGIICDCALTGDVQDIPANMITYSSRDYTYILQRSGISYKQSHMMQPAATGKSTHEAPTAEEQR